MTDNSTTITDRASSFVQRHFAEHHDEALTYHNIAHTMEVVDAAARIGEACGLTGADLEVVILAAWFHDVGITEVYLNHEDRSVEIAERFLREHDYHPENIRAVSRCIMVTSVHVHPSTLQEEVICDADLEHLGRKTFWKRAELLRHEWEVKLGKVFSDLDWLRSQQRFLQEFSFYTEEAKTARLRRLEKNRAKVDQVLESLEKGGTMAEAIERIDGKKDGKGKNKVKTDFMGRGDRGVETMFRTTSRNHVTFSSMVDSKANIMLSINALVISVVISVLFRKLDTNPYMAIPTFLFLGVCLTTIVFAVLASRPKVSSGTFTREDIENKAVNLLFFGNFYNVSVDDFEWGMQEMLKDKDYLYGSMIRDFYYLGQVLGKKYRYLRISYNVFMYGFVASILLYVIMFMVFANQPIDLVPFE
ncbi:MAG: hypothetical protein C0600_05560 [Ignavibacteria bacterium]|nr:MAG: hypothetical protein C0600_05560 [Ignavibacteria bacterium]